jgi:hypothetical protein
MTIEVDLASLKEYLYFIRIESFTKGGASKALVVETLLEQYKAMRFVHPDWEMLPLDNIILSKYNFGVGTYINHTKKSLIIALSGTKNTHDIKPDLEILRGKIPARFHKLDDYLKTLFILIPSLSENPEYKITFTGHSLGGFLAQLGYIKRKSENPNFQAQVIAFDSPGAQKHALKLLTIKYLNDYYSLPESAKMAAETLELDDYKNNITNVIRRFNVINTSGKQIGSYLWIAESCLKFDLLSRLRRWTDLSHHKLSSFINALQVPEIYHFYKISCPTSHEPILIKSAENNIKSILLNIRELQKKNVSRKVFNEYITTVLKDGYLIFHHQHTYTDTNPEAHHYLELISNNGFTFIDRSTLFTKILDFVRGIGGRKKLLDLQQEN